jgi:hypothetical protein
MFIGLTLELSDLRDKEMNMVFKAQLLMCLRKCWYVLTSLKLVLPVNGCHLELHPSKY